MEHASKSRVAKAKAKLRQIAWEETRGLHLKLIWLRILSILLPDATPAAISEWLRSVGVPVGSGTLVSKLPHFNGKRPLFANLAIGRGCLIEEDVVLDLQDRIELGDHVHLAQGAMLLTSTHQIGPKEHRAGPLQLAPVIVEANAKIGPGALICPGVRIGAGATIDARAMVNKDIPAGSFASGNPATAKPRNA